MVMLKQKIPESPDDHPQCDLNKEAHDSDRDKAHHNQHVLKVSHGF